MNPFEIIPRNLSRPPNDGEIRFGYGCRIYYTPTVLLPMNRRFVTIEGVRWSVIR